MHLFSRKDAPTGDVAVEMRAVCPGERETGSSVFTAPIQKSCAAFDIGADAPVTALLRDHPAREIGVVFP